MSIKSDRVTTVIVYNNEGVRAMVETLLKKLDRDGDGIIGFDAELTSEGTMPVRGQKTRVSHLLFSNGELCFVFLLVRLYKLPDSVLSLLRNPEFTFVGAGIEEIVARLGKEHETGCRNAVELGALAAEVTRNPRLRHCGIDLLEQGIRLPKIQRPSVVYCNNEKASYYDDLFKEFNLDQERLSRAVANTCAYHRIGKKLLEG